MKKKFALFIIPILVILIGGCVNEQVPTPVPTETVIEQPVETTQRPTEVPVETSVISTHNIGESVNDNNTKITLNGVRYTKNIDDARSEGGNQFVIINVTIENIGADKNITYIWPQFTLISSGAREGMPNDIDEAASEQLAIPLNGEDIIPGDTRQGELAFQIPEDAKDLKLRFEYSPDSSKGGELEIFKLDR